MLGSVGGLVVSEFAFRDDKFYLCVGQLTRFPRGFTLSVVVLSKAGFGVERACGHQRLDFKL